MRLRISKHAYKRYYDRGGRRKLTPSMVERRLYPMLKKGAKPCGGALPVPLGDGLIGIVVPEVGAWELVTVLQENMVVITNMERGRE